MNSNIDKEVKDQLYVTLMPLLLNITLNICFFVLSGWTIGIIKIIGIFITYLIFGIFLSLMKKSSKAIATLTTFFIILLDINLIRTSITGEPITFNDINFISQITSVTKLGMNNILQNIYWYLGILLGEIIFLVMIVKLSKKHLVEMKNTKARVIILTTCLLVLVILFLPFEATNNFYLNLFFRNNDVKDYKSYTTNYDYYKKNGIIGGMYGNLLLTRTFKPASYEEKEVEEFLNMSGDYIQKKTLGKPNIIMIFSEAFWDVTKISEVKFNTNPIEKYNELKKNGKTINLLVPSFGGMSENVSMEILTGEKMNYFANGYIPIMSLYKEKNSSRIPSLIKELKNNDYSSKIVFGHDYYNAKQAFESIGFDTYLNYYNTQAYPDNIKGEELSDKYMIDEVINELDNKAEGSKIFYMASTIENHMPFDKSKFENYDIGITESTLTEQEQEQVLVYAQGLHDASNELSRLYEFVKEYDEPTIIIFLGDHLPYLYNEKNELLVNNVEYFNTNDEKENIYRKYSTEALILSNYNVNLDEIPTYMSADMLLNSVLNNMDVKLSNYYKWLYQTRNVIPCYNKYIFMDSKNMLYYYDELPEDMKEIYKKREDIQYYFNFSD